MSWGNPEGAEQTLPDPQLVTDQIPSHAGFVNLLMMGLLA